MLRELEPFQEDNAITLARDAQQAYGISAKPIRMAGETSGEPGRLFVTLGEFATLEDARAYQDHLQGLIIRHIFEEKTPAREGMVMIRDPRGNIVARNAKSLRLVPINVARHSLYLMNILALAEIKASFLTNSPLKLLKTLASGLRV